jgi:Arc/MetJ-type ribon-helix-helix transcriptional regulator
LRYYPGNTQRRYAVARSTKVLSVSVPERLAEEMERMAEEEGVSKSELVRLMVRAYRRERSEEDFLRLQRELAPKAKEIGVESEENVERLVLEGR